MKLYLLAVLTAFICSSALTAVLIPILRKMKAGQNILVYVEEHKNKSGTPTMGGLAFVAATLFSCAIFIRGIDRPTVISLSVGLSYMCVGFLDDFLKHRRKENLGLRAWQKATFQFFIALFVGIYCQNAGYTKWNVPFFNSQIELGFWTVPLVLFVFLGTVNGVNLTDGLDGLAASVSVPFFLFMAALILLQGEFLNAATICFSLVGALCAYLLFNVSPARVFMGDTGSLALGGFAACVGVLTGNALYVATVGVAFVASVLSVIIQVSYFKLTHGKRVFLMSPLHHHLQKKGLSESRIAYVYFSITALMAILNIVFII